MVLVDMGECVMKSVAGRVRASLILIHVVNAVLLGAHIILYAEIFV